jgi:hypothetical protein
MTYFASNSSLASRPSHQSVVPRADVTRQQERWPTGRICFHMGGMSCAVCTGGGGLLFHPSSASDDAGRGFARETIALSLSLTATATTMRRHASGLATPTSRNSPKFAMGGGGHSDDSTDQQRGRRRRSCHGGPSHLFLVGSRSRCTQRRTRPIAIWDGWRSTRLTGRTAHPRQR